jgi:hypothetical protein
MLRFSRQVKPIDASRIRRLGGAGVRNSAAQLILTDGGRQMLLSLPGFVALPSVPGPISSACPRTSEHNAAAWHGALRRPGLAAAAADPG